MTLLTVVFMFPTGGPNPDAQGMNYSSVIYAATVFGPMLYYFVDANKWFKGPVHTLDDASIEGIPVDEVPSPDSKSGMWEDKQAYLNVTTV